MSVTIKVDGLDKVLGSIKKFTEEVKDNIKKAVEESSINVAGKAKQKVPIDTGNLKRAITHKMLDEGYTGEIGTYDVHYAPHVEYGTSRTPAKPYLHPSLEEELPNFYQSIENVIKEASR